MVEIEFNFNQAITNIQANLEDPFRDVINKFIQKSLLEPGSVNFLANGKLINPDESVESHMSNLNKESKKMKIIVTMAENDDQNKEQVINKIYLYYFLIEHRKKNKELLIKIKKY